MRTVMGMIVVLLAATAWAAGGRSEARADEDAAGSEAQMRIIRSMRAAWDGVQSLFLEVQVEAKPLVARDLVRRYLGTYYIRPEHTILAYKGQMRYSKLDGPGTAEAVAPGVTPDFNVIWNSDQWKTQDPAGFASKTFDLEPLLEFAYDGRRAQDQTRAGQSTVIRFASDSEDDSCFSQEYLRLIFRMLPDPYHPENDRKDQRLPDCIENGRFRLSGRTVSVEGHRCLVLEGGPDMELDVDPELNYAVRRYVWYYAGTKVPGELTTHREFREVVQGVFLPRSGSREVCGPPKAPEGFRGKPLLAYQYKVKKLTVNDVPDDLFKLKITPGNLVGNDTLKNPYSNSTGVVYRMPANAERADEAIDKAMALHAREDFNKKAKIWIAGTLIALVVLANAVLVIRRMSARTKAADV